MPDVAVDAGASGQSASTATTREALAADELPGDLGPHPVELRRPVGRLTQQDDLTVADALQQRPDVGPGDRAERLGHLRHQAADPVRRVRPRGRNDAGRSRPGHRDGLGLRSARRHTGRRAPEPLGTDQRDEPHGTEVLLLEGVTTSADPDELLAPGLGPDRDDQPAALGELLQQRLRYRRPARGHDDGVEGCGFRVPERAVTPHDVRVVVAQAIEHRPCPRGQRLVALDRPHVRRHPAQHRGAVAGPGPHLQHPVVRSDLGRLGHDGDDVGLRDGLALRDRERVVVVGELGQVVGQEPFAGHRAHGPQHAGVPDAPGREVPFDHAAAALPGVSPQVAAVGAGDAWIRSGRCCHVRTLRNEPVGRRALHDQHSSTRRPTSPTSANRPASDHVRGPEPEAQLESPGRSAVRSQSKMTCPLRTSTSRCSRCSGESEK